MSSLLQDAPLSFLISKRIARAKSKKLSATSKKLLDAASKSGLRSRHIAVLHGPLEVPMIATLISCNRSQAALISRLRRLRPSLTLFTLFILFPALALAQSPFDTGFTAMQTLFTGTVAKVASLIAIVVGGYQFAHGEPGAKKTLAGVAAGTGIAVLATNVLTWLWGV
jgi:type IV secretory pathway VirB2 component (pilin)